MRHVQHQRRRYRFGQSFQGQEEGKQRKVINVQTREPIDYISIIRKMLPWAIVAGLVYWAIDNYVFS